MGTPIQADYYAALGVPKTATQDEIKRAYRKLALKFHPDKNPEASAQFRLLSEAFATLFDPEKRKKYDVHFGIPKTVRALFASPVGLRWMRPLMPQVVDESVRGRDVVMVAEKDFQLRKRQFTLITPEPALRCCIIPGLGKSGKKGGQAGDVYIFIEEEVP